MEAVWSFLKNENSQVRWYMSVIPGLRKLRQEDLNFEDSWSYKVRPCLKKFLNRAIISSSNTTFRYKSKRTEVRISKRSLYFKYFSVQHYPQKRKTQSHS
jgi:hypothetical protein